MHNIIPIIAVALLVAGTGYILAACTYGCFRTVPDSVERMMSYMTIGLVCVVAGMVMG